MTPLWAMPVVGSEPMHPMNPMTSHIRDFAPCDIHPANLNSHPRPAVTLRHSTKQPAGVLEKKMSQSDRCGLLLLCTILPSNHLVIPVFSSLEHLHLAPYLATLCYLLRLKCTI